MQYKYKSVDDTIVANSHGNSFGNQRKVMEFFFNFLVGTLKFLSCPFDFEIEMLFGSAVPSGSGAFQMSTCPSASILRRGRADVRNASVTVFPFWYEAFLG